VPASIDPIAPTDLWQVGEFLHTHLNPGVPAATWAAAAGTTWVADTPNHGFMLRVDGVLSGVLLAFYSERTLAGCRERFCNLGAWCVVPEQRLHSLRLLKTALAQPGYHFTDLSPSGAVVPLSRRLGFHDLDTTTALLPTLLAAGRIGRTRVVTDPRTVESLLTPADLRLYQDHQSCAAARHAVLLGPQGPCYVMYRRVTRKRVGAFAALLYVSDPERFHSLAHALARHLLLTQGVIALLVELRIGGRPRNAYLMSSSRPKMFKSDKLSARQVDDLYSELCAVPW
jgi:hypothetical protein